MTLAAALLAASACCTAPIEPPEPPACAAPPGPAGARVAWFDHAGDRPVPHYVTFAQCQFDIALEVDPATSLAIASNPYPLLARLRECAAIACEEGVDVLVFPELALGLPPALRDTALEELAQTAAAHDMVIVAGSYYDADRYARVPIIGPDWSELGYKYRPARVECSVLAGTGMRAGPAVPAVATDKGTLLILTCVDMISDAAQYAARSLAAAHEVQIVLNNCYNDASLEFLVEANALARRHPVFVLVTNVINPAIEEDGVRAYGHTALCANVRQDRNAPGAYEALVAALPETLLARGEERPHVAFDTVVADLGFRQRAMLIYDLNLHLTRVPLITNAPDQGYPPVRNLRVIALGEEPPGQR